MEKERITPYSIFQNILGLSIVVACIISLLTTIDFNLLKNALIWSIILFVVAPIIFEFEDMDLSIYGIYTVSSAILFPWQYAVLTILISNILYYIYDYIRNINNKDELDGLYDAIYYISATVIQITIISILSSFVVSNKIVFENHIWLILLLVTIDSLLSFALIVITLINDGAINKTIKDIFNWIKTHLKDSYDMYLISITAPIIIIIMFTYFSYTGLLFASSFILTLRAAYVRFNQVISIEENSCIDTLSQVKNRKYYSEKLSEVIPDGDAIVFIDVNGLKKVNDTYGHEYGDEYIIKSAKILRRAIDRVDTVMRVGGDEFVLHVKNGTTERCIEILKKIEELCLEEPMTLSDNTIINISMSVGVAQSPMDGNEKDVLAKLADDRMYANKHNGTNDLIRQNIY